MNPSLDDSLVMRSLAACDLASERRRVARISARLRLPSSAWTPAMRRLLSLAPISLLAVVCMLPAQKAERPPHGQDKMPGPALTPEQAIKAMKVPDGFTVE